MTYIINLKMYIYILFNIKYVIKIHPATLMEVLICKCAEV